MKLDTQERWWLAEPDDGVVQSAIVLNHGEEYEEYFTPRGGRYDEYAAEATKAVLRELKTAGHRASDGVLTVRRVYDSTYKCWNVLARWEPYE